MSKSFVSGEAELGEHYGAVALPSYLQFALITGGWVQFAGQLGLLKVKIGSGL